MKRFLSSILICVIAIGLAGCGEKSKTTEKKSASTPGGTSTTETTKETKTTGENPPAPPK